MQFSLQSRYQKSPSISIKGPDPQQPLLDRPSQQPFQLKRSKPPSPKLQEPAPSQPQPRADRSLTEKLEPEVAIMLFAGIAFVVATTIASVASAADNGINTNLVQQLKVATTNMDRMDLLPKSSDWFFDFTKSDKYTFSPGGVAYAEAATFPATIGYGISMVSSAFPPHGMI